MPSNPFSNEAPAFVFKPAMLSKSSASVAANAAVASDSQTDPSAGKDARVDTASSPPPSKLKRKRGDSSKSSSAPLKRGSEKSPPSSVNSGKRARTSPTEKEGVNSEIQVLEDPESATPAPAKLIQKDGDAVDSVLPSPDRGGNEVAGSSEGTGVPAIGDISGTPKVSSGTLILSEKEKPSKAPSKGSVPEKTKASFSFDRSSGKPLTKDRAKCKELFDLIGSTSSGRTPLSPAERKDLSSSVALCHIRTGAMVHRLLLDSEIKLSSAGKDSEVAAKKVNVLTRGLWKAQEELVEAKKASIEALEKYRAANEKVAVLSQEVGMLKGELQGVNLQKEELSSTIAKLGQEREVLQMRLAENAGDVVGKFSRITAYVQDRELLDPIISSYIQVTAQVRLLESLNKRGVQVPRKIAEELEVEASKLLQEFASLPTPYLRPTDRCEVAPALSPFGRSDRKRSDDYVPELALGVVDQFGSNERIMSVMK